MLGVALLTFLCGGGLALCVALWTRTLRQALGNIRFMVTDTAVRLYVIGRATVPVPARTTGRLPYAVAIACGAALGVVVIEGWYR